MADALQALKTFKIVRRTLRSQDNVRFSITSGSYEVIYERNKAHDQHEAADCAHRRCTACGRLAGRRGHDVPGGARTGDRHDSPHNGGAPPRVDWTGYQAGKRV